MWNEANLKDFYLGTPAQMAQLTKDARAALNSVGSGAALVAASTTVRAKGPVGKFGKAYGAAMRKAGAWGAVNAVSAHFYPPAKEGPATRVSYIKTVKKYYKRYGAGRKPLWDTEMNYGDTRKYMKVKRQYTGATAATYVARTYIDSMRYGVYRVFWYGWDINVLGTDMTSGRQPDVRGQGVPRDPGLDGRQDLAGMQGEVAASPPAPCARRTARSRPSATHPRRSRSRCRRARPQVRKLDGTTGPRRRLEDHADDAAGAVHGRLTTRVVTKPPRCPRTPRGLRAEVREPRSGCRRRTYFGFCAYCEAIGPDCPTYLEFRSTWP